MSETNDGSQFDRLPATEENRRVAERPTRAEVIAFFADRYGIDGDVFDAYTFWEKGTGKIWAYAGEAPDPIDVEALGIHLLRTNQHHWKPTTDAMQRFGRHATNQVCELSRSEARQFWGGETIPLDEDDLVGYVVVCAPIVGRHEPLGVGLAIDGELRSQIPKGRRQEL